MNELSTPSSQPPTSSPPSPPSSLPITHLTLFKHGVGFFERRGPFSGDRLDLTFAASEMNDILQSLMPLDQGGGRVLSVTYDTPRDLAEQLARTTIYLGDKRALRDLLHSLRGRQITLHQTAAGEVSGRVVGLDEFQGADRSELPDQTLVSLLDVHSGRVTPYPLETIQGITPDDEQASKDLAFFLSLVQKRDTTRRVSIHLTPGDHDLLLTYNAPAPTWRASYRLVLEPAAEEAPSNASQTAGRALLQGWGIFDNTLDENLTDVSLTLAGGMPISFTYELYEPFTPERPHHVEEARTAPGPVEFEIPTTLPAAAPAALHDDVRMYSRPAPAPRAADFAQTAAGQAQAVDRGELFSYEIETPITVERGRSAMVPLLNTFLPVKKELLYNGRKLPKHPTAVLRFANLTGAPLERGPVTLSDQNGYLGEAILSFTPAAAEIILPYAVELGVTVDENQGQKREDHQIRLAGTYLRHEKWSIRWQSYEITNKKEEGVTILVETIRDSNYNLFASPDPVETTASTWRFAVEVPPQGRSILRIQTRMLVWEQQALADLTWSGIESYLGKGLVEAHTKERLAKLRNLLLPIEKLRAQLQQINRDQDRLIEQQRSIQGNMSQLGRQGEEGTLRARYVAQLAESEDRLAELRLAEERLAAEIQRLQNDIHKEINTW